MSLALVNINPIDFQHVYAHLAAHTRHRNMHLRQTRERGGKRVLRYLHAMYASPFTTSIDGVISGPGLFWHYRLKTFKTTTQMQVFVHQSSVQDDARIQRTFLSEIIARVNQEQRGQQFYPKRTAGEFYLRRGQPGMSPAHPNCQAAMSAGALDSRFVAQLQSWNFLVLHP